MTEKEKIIAQMCIKGINKLDAYITLDEPYWDNAISECIDVLHNIHRLVNPEYDKLCKEVDEKYDDNV